MVNCGADCRFNCGANCCANCGADCSINCGVDGTVNRVIKNTLLPILLKIPKNWAHTSLGSETSGWSRPPHDP